jgi:hypothetical protein
MSRNAAETAEFSLGRWIEIWFIAFSIMPSGNVSE